ncbi:tetratricopeptide repeat protein [Mycolicibacterium sp. BiH015]|uniref:tetratricopeptide repeat protein n=1 Tax=Mycolicibacterium sp. BiH015 TaxID=3018808 RepID=UPI0022E4F1B0|nr:tetratricopeptide repeat protein [Mycolicibacterium sp. BiH015]MDA2890026.1 tetratricopeptide repeat protein [Mycolicibacterium sp. BiH015]
MSDVATMTASAQASLGAKDYGAAASAAWSVLTVEPSNEHAMRLYALALHGQGRLADALSMAGRLVSEHPRSPLALYTYASLLHESRQDQQALAVLDDALRLDSTNPDALVLRGDIFRTVWGAQAAEQQYLEALRIAPDHALGHHNLAVNRLRWGTLTQAVRGLLTADRANQALHPLVIDNIGLALVRVLRMATASVVFPAVALIVVMAANDDGMPTVLPRIAAGVLGLALVVPLVWVARTVPSPLLGAVVRQRFLLGLRLGFVALAVLLGVVTAVVGANSVSDVAGTLLLFGVFGLTVLGFVTGS